MDWSFKCKNVNLYPQVVCILNSHVLKYPNVVHKYPHVVDTCILNPHVLKYPHVASKFPHVVCILNHISQTSTCLYIKSTCSQISPCCS